MLPPTFLADEKPKRSALAAPRLAVLKKPVVGEGEDDNDFGMNYD